MGLLNNDVLRFQQPQPNTEKIGTENRPYNAGPTGPLCPQLGVVTQPIITAVAIIPIQSTIEIVLKQILPGDDVDATAEALAQEIVDGLNLFFEIEIDDKTRVGQLLEEWLDISLSAN